MHDSYTRHACGITKFKPTWRSWIVDRLILIASYIFIGAIIWSFL